MSSEKETRAWRYIQKAIKLAEGEDSRLSSPSRDGDAFERGVAEGLRLHDSIVYAVEHGRNDEEIDTLIRSTLELD